MNNQYTLESLRILNPSYNSQYNLDQSDVDMANGYVQLIEQSRSNTTPRPGDIIRYTDPYGHYYHFAHLESIGKQGAYICERTMIPLIYRNSNNNSICCDTSGGAWANIPLKKLKYLGDEMKCFKDWGHCGACVNGAVKFEATVSVWEYKAPAF